MSTLKEEIESASAKIESLVNNREIHSIIAKVISKAVGAEFASIWVYDNEYLIRESEDGIKKISMKSKEGLLYQCFVTQKSILNNYLSSAKGYAPHIDNSSNIRIKSKIMIPLRVRGTFMGIFTVYSSVNTKKSFGKKDLDILHALMPLVVDAVFRINFNNSQGLLVDRRQGESSDTSRKRRKGDIHEKLKSIEIQSNKKIDTQKILEMTSNIVHDIRTPANGLLGFLEILGENIKDRRLKEYILNARKSALLIETLTTSILDGVSDKTEPVLSEDTEIAGSKRFFADIAELFSANMYKKNIAYSIFIDPSLPNRLNIDSMKIKRVILNLIGNAVKFTPEHASIEFSIFYNKKENKLKFSVKDTGIGIDKEVQKEIFEAFRQAERNTKEKFGGTGLGLAICSAYVKSMGGELLLESQLDKGSHFYFDIFLENMHENAEIKLLENLDNIFISILCDKENMPVVNTVFKYLLRFGLIKNQIKAITHMKNIAKNTSHIIVFEHKINNDLISFIEEKDIKQLIVEENFLALDAQSYPNAMLISKYSYYCDSLYTFVNDKYIPKVLIVEDDSISSMLLTAMLEDEYCEIDVAFDGKEGEALLLKALASNIPYDIVYMDENMPLLSGTDMIRKYRVIEEQKISGKRVKTVSISGDIHKNIDNDIDYLATKPFKKKEIISIFNECVVKI